MRSDDLSLPRRRGHGARSRHGDVRDVRPVAGRHARDEAPDPPATAGGAPTEEEVGARDGTSRGPLAELIDRRPPRRRPSWRDLPWPPRTALLGAAVLALVAGGAVHLSTAGTAVPVLETSTAPAVERSGEVPSPPGGPPPGTAAPSRPAPSASTRPGPGASPSTGTIVVHVTGAVAEPGVVELPAGSRVDDAVESAGGAGPDADLAAVNLARPAVDGEQIHVPVPGEEPPPVLEAALGPSAPAPGADAPAPASGGEGLIDLNTADARALEELPGVGPALAQRIIDHREANGPFASVEDLDQVSGIGPATLEEIRPRATV